MMRAQVGLEYAAIIVFALVLLIPAALYVYQGALVQASLNSAELAVKKLAAAADAVKAGSPGARLQVEVYIPPGVNSSQAGGMEVQLKVYGNRGELDEVYRVTAANLTQSALPSIEGVYVFTVTHELNGNVSITG